MGAFDHREEVRLLIDGFDRNIPLQYRFLSLYKILELHFKTGDRWRKPELSSFCEKFAAAFKAKGVEAKPANHLHDLRDKCAHIKSGSRGERFGVTHLNHGEAVKVETILSILAEMTIDVLNVRGKGSFSIERRSWAANELPLPAERDFDQAVIEPQLRRDEIS